MRSLFLFLFVCSTLAAHAAGPFEAIPPSGRDLFRFQLNRNFYADETAWKADMDRSRQIADRLTTYRGKVLATPANLLACLVLIRDWSDLGARLGAYVAFRRAVHTDDRLPYEANDKLAAELGAKTSFFRVELKGLTEGRLRSFLEAEPRLREFEYFLRDIMRAAAHTLSEDKESVLAALSPELESWQEEVYQRLFDRHSFPTRRVEGREMSVHADFEALLRCPDSRTREWAFRSYYRFFRENADLLGLALRRLLMALNGQALLRGFPTYFHQALFDMYLTRPEVDSLYRQIEEALPLYRSWQVYVARRFEREYGLKRAQIWDMELTPKAMVPLRIDAAKGCVALQEALSAQGSTYAAGLTRFLDPAQGRLDIVGGPGREQGAFCVGNHGFFMDNYQGFLDDLSTIAHETGHGMHSQLVLEKCGSLLHENGPAYMTESYAMFAEWLLREHLLKTEKDPAVLAGIRWNQVKEMMMLFELARRAKFEMLSYDGVASGTVTDATGFGRICLDVGKQYDLFFASNADLEFHYIRKNHYWTAPTYYLNYVFAHILALKYLDLYQADPAGFAKRYTEMVGNGFDRPATALLKDFLGIELTDPQLLAGVFRLMEIRFKTLQER